MDGLLLLVDEFGLVFLLLYQLQVGFVEDVETGLELLVAISLLASIMGF